MDYIEAFKNLKPNNKWGRKSPHKAVLMLTVIELYETNILIDNEIRYDETLNSTFLKIWNMVLPNEPRFHSDAYLPFWYLQSDSFWHIVPIRGKEDILSLMRDSNIKPSEAKLIDSVKYVELDEDLYFLMTLPSGRSSLKRALLETYTNLDERQIARLSESTENTIDHSQLALSEYDRILYQNQQGKGSVCVEADNQLVSQFISLSEELQITINIQYFSFLKSHRNEREMFKEICPTVYDLYDKLINNPIKQSELLPSFAFVYENFLYDLKISLMNEEGSIELVEQIQNAINYLHEEEELESHIESLVDKKIISKTNTENRIKTELVSTQDYYIENGIANCYIFNKYGQKIFTDEGKLKFVCDKLYRFHIKPQCITVKSMIQEGSIWIKGSKKIVAYNQTDLYRKAENNECFIDDVEDVIDHESFTSCRIKVNGQWYDYSGMLIEDENGKEKSPNIFSVTGPNDVFIPKGRLKNIYESATSSYDFLLVMAVVEFMQLSPQPSIITFDKLACMMISIAWEILSKDELAKEKENDLRECVEYLIEESNEEMDHILAWNSPKKDIYSAIKDFPMYGLFEDTVDIILEETPWNVLRAWLKEEDASKITLMSKDDKTACLYAINDKKRDPYIEVKDGWKRYLYKEHDNLMEYYTKHYLEYLEGI